MYNMKMVVHEEEPEISMFQNFRAASRGDAASKGRSGEDSTVAAATPGFKLFRLVAVSLGLLCILQAALNICLRLTLISQRNSLREERDELKKMNSDAMAWSKSLTEERDELERKLNNFTQHCEWVNFDSSAYCVSSTMKNWQESRDDCIQKGADLVIINSQEEQHFLLQFERFVWIGLTDSTAEGEWKWVDGTPMNESYWSSQEPNGGTNENCGEVKRIFSTNSWNDEECSMKHSWICEKRVSP
ncbi:C-type lectin domain family 4 member M-like isoform X2 [Stegastes partitus]|uniref:C-type lectin domain family 4 member M-like isoform X2 n=1 Tax=Stegastes partitus TaxID=144197 RepID=A0A9Y4KHQ3_9TELE|nr:PREDICTED: C-type lectin domain family 4 member M-like isoform X2 [Stegastes partitus]